ncbi:scarecrow-like protein 33 [Cicer arietinum]|uniref:Scarecrow-like protein 33 n=1 Tax=Cicer arietinum TaxID=3827 RepID=A0A1S2YMS7_CICAR|nr:scarecrow-like protein 33 [Cicer arietinum]
MFCGKLATMTSVTDPSLEDTDFLETIKFISQILMEENVEQLPVYDSLSLQITEKSFHDALFHKTSQNPLDIHNSNAGTSNTHNSPDTILGDHGFQFNSSAIPHTFSNSVSDGLRDLDTSITNMLAQNIFSDADSVSQFRKGLEEATKFLPPQPQLLTALESSHFNKIGEKDNHPLVLKGRKNHEREEIDTKEEEERSNKQLALGVVDEDELSEMFDKALLNVEHLPHCNEQNYWLQNEQANTEKQQPSSNRRKACPKKQDRKHEETVDLRNLLLLCSQSVYVNDTINANELLKQIKQHSSPFGDATQRLSHYFANGLNARLIGDGTIKILYLMKTATGCFKVGKVVFYMLPHVGCHHN